MGTGVVAAVFDAGALDAGCRESFMATLLSDGSIPIVDRCAAAFTSLSPQAVRRYDPI